MSEWNHDVASIPRVIGAKNVEVAYVATNGELSTAIVAWDGQCFVTSRIVKEKIRMCPPDTIYAWKPASPPPRHPTGAGWQTQTAAEIADVIKATGNG